MGWGRGWRAEGIQAPSKGSSSGFEIQSGKDLSAKTPATVTSVNTRGLEREGGSGPFANLHNALLCSRST